MKDAFYIYLHLVRTELRVKTALLAANNFRLTSFFDCVWNDFILIKLTARLIAKFIHLLKGKRASKLDNWRVKQWPNWSLITLWQTREVDPNFEYFGGRQSIAADLEQTENRK